MRALPVVVADIFTKNLFEVAQDPPDRAGRDPDAELEQLALDANASPAPVLLTQTNNELHQFSTHRRATRASLPSPTSPLVFGSLAMPPQQGLWGDHERAPSGSGEQPAECGEDCPIRGPILDTPVKLPLENTDLVSEHHDLDVPLGLGPSTRHNETEHATQAEVEEREEHAG